jgi:hypothetical protein
VLTAKKPHCNTKQDAQNKEKCIQGIEWKRPLGKYTHRRKDNIKMNLMRNRMRGSGLDSFGSG